MVSASKKWAERLLVLGLGFAGFVWLARRVEIPLGIVESHERPAYVRAAAALKHVDEAGTGVVSLAELTMHMRLSGLNPTDADATNYRQRLRAMGTTAITAEVLAEVIEDYNAARPPETERAELLEAWNVVDADGDGIVHGDEMEQLVKMLTTMGEPLDDEEMHHFLKELDEDGDGRITLHEFTRLLGDLDDKEAWTAGVAAAARKDEL